MNRLAVALLLTTLAAAAEEAPLPDGLYARIETPRGTLTCRLDPDRAPLTVANFVGLAEGRLGPAPRKPFFDGLKFHRVVPGFVVQGGDPLGTGEGGPGYTFPDEFSPALGHNAVGVLSMANDGPDTNGSQFFITLAPVEQLNFMYAVFGSTVRGLEVLPKIVQGDSMKVAIVRIGPKAASYAVDDARFASLVARTPKYTFAPKPGPSAHFDDPDRLLPVDPSRAEYDNFKLGNFERSTRLKVYVRLFKKFVPRPGIPDLTRLAASLAHDLGVERDGVVALYDAQAESWAFYVGNNRRPSFTGLPGVLDDATLEAALARFRERCRARAARYADEAIRTKPELPRNAALRTRTSVGATLDELLQQLTR